MKRFAALWLVLTAVACDAPVELTPLPSRESRIPAGAERVTPETDLFPPILHADGWEAPVPVPGPINSAGGEDSPYVTPDGNTLYFFFTPDVSLPAEEQLHDSVTGVYVSHRVQGAWTEPRRVPLVEPGELSLDGCATIQGEVMWFCSARAGFTGVHWFTAQWVEGTWADWDLADFDPAYEVGELHLTADGSQIYYDSALASGAGGHDIWMIRLVDGAWQLPQHVSAVNTPADELRPFVSQDGTELWITRTHQGYPALFLSRWVDGTWSEPELIISQFAAEPSVDDAGNIYFAHHFFRDGEMIEADIYVATKKR